MITLIPYIKDFVQSDKVVQIPISGWEKLYKRLSKLEQKEKLTKQFRRGLQDIKEGKTFPVEILLNNTNI